MSNAERTDPKLWETVKEEITQSGKGGEKGQWSARKAQLAVQEYKKRGGGYEGEKSEDNDLHQWTEEDWGTKSGGKSRETGERYLPKEAREDLSDEEYERTSDKKREDAAKGKQHSKQPEDVAQKTAKHRDGDDAEGGSGGPEPTKEELMEAARTLNVEGRSKMSKDELKSAVVDALSSDDADLSKAELQNLARAFDLQTKSSASKSELKDAITAAAR